MEELVPMLVQLGPWGIVAAGAIVAVSFIAKALRKKGGNDGE